MRTLTYLVACSLDGRIADTDGGFAAFRTDPEYLAAIMEEWPETLPTHLRGPLGIGDRPNRHFDTVIMGRSTYEVGRREGVTSPYAHLRQYVVSGSMASSPDPSVTLVRDDPLGVVRDLKAEEGLGIWLCGGGRLAQALAPEIDELVLKVNPLVLGDGIPLFAPGAPVTATELVGLTRHPNGVTVQRHRPIRS